MAYIWKEKKYWKLNRLIYLVNTMVYGKLCEALNFLLIRSSRRNRFCITRNKKWIFSSTISNLVSLFIHHLPEGIFRVRG